MFRAAAAASRNASSIVGHAQLAAACSRHSHSSKAPICSMGSAWMASRTWGLLQKAHISLQAGTRAGAGQMAGTAQHRSRRRPTDPGKRVHTPQATERQSPMPAAPPPAPPPNSQPINQHTPGVKAGWRVAQLGAQQRAETGHRARSCPAHQRPRAVRGHRRCQGGGLGGWGGRLCLALGSGVGVVAVVAALENVVHVDA